MKKVQQGFTLIELMIVVAIIGILAAIAIPQYQTFIAKSQVSRSVGEAGALKSMIEDCYNNGITAVGPASNDPVLCDTQATGSSILIGPTQGDIVVPATEGVAQAVMAVNGVATITATFGNKANVNLAGESIVWARDIDGNWTCTGVQPLNKQKYNTNQCPR